MINIDIVMATYNGEQFILEQIGSIKKQTFKNWTLIISDDASSDHTVSIINDIIKTDSRIKLVNTNRQGGVVKNFEKALQFTQSDYIVFTDQDDLWPVDRLQQFVDVANNINGHSNPVPFMLYTDMALINENGEIISDSYYEANKIDPLENLKFEKLLWKSTVYGCTTMINRALLNISVPFPENIPMHDQWLALNALLNSNLNYYAIKSVKYRQHEKNVVGGLSKNYYAKIKDLRKNLRGIFNVVPKIKAMQAAIDADKSNKENFLFALKYILPDAFRGNKKMYAFLMFIGFIIT